MKKLALSVFVALVMSSFFASAVYAYCYYPRWRHTEYYQRHQSCGIDPSTGLRICTDYWSLDGECYRDCDGTETCTGDTQVRADTIVESESGQCDPICE